MNTIFDTRQSYLAVKAHEGIIAFAGLLIDIDELTKHKEGIVKIASNERAYKGDYLTLTFMIDAAGGDNYKTILNQRFASVREDSLRPWLGKELEMVNTQPLNDLQLHASWFIEEVNLYLRTAGGSKKTLIEQDLIPAFEKILPCKFKALEWWPQETLTSPSSDLPAWAESQQFKRFQKMLRQWFGLKKE